MRASWASSARLHEMYGNHPTTMERILEMYGLKPTGHEGEGTNLEDVTEVHERFAAAIPNDVADAPIFAAIRLMASNPEALALIIKHYRKDFERFYEEERSKSDANA